jgi:hypothetical protein
MTIIDSNGLQTFLFSNLWHILLLVLDIVLDSVIGCTIYLVNITNTNKVLVFMLLRNLFHIYVFDRIMVLSKTMHKLTGMILGLPHVVRIHNVRLKSFLQQLVLELPFFYLLHFRRQNVEGGHFVLKLIDILALWIQIFLCIVEGVRSWSSLLLVLNQLMPFVKRFL